MSISTLPTPSTLDADADNAIIESALNILHSRMTLPDTYITSPQDCKNYLKLKLAEKEHEIFAVLFLDTRHGIIKISEMFRGTIDGSSVHTREVVKEALACNAAAIILVHNHPSGISDPSEADKMITKRLKDSLALIDVRVLDHLIIGVDIVSFTERGLL